MLVFLWDVASSRLCFLLDDWIVLFSTLLLPDMLLPHYSLEVLMCFVRVRSDMTSNGNASISGWLRFGPYADRTRDPPVSFILKLSMAHVLLWTLPVGRSRCSSLCVSASVYQPLVEPSSLGMSLCCRAVAVADRLSL